MSLKSGELVGTDATASSHDFESAGELGDAESALGSLREGSSRWPRLHGVARLVERLVFWSDTALRVPGTSFRFGLDPILGLLFPGAGDAAGGVVSLSVVLLALQYRLPVWVVGRMVWNLALDAAVGSVPLLGDAFDFGFRANQRNMVLLREHTGRAQPAAMPKRYYVWGALLFVLALALVALPIVISVWLLAWVFGGQV